MITEQPTDADKKYALSVAAGELLHADPDSAATYAATLIEDLFAAGRTGSLRSHLDDLSLEETLRNLLPVMGYVDYDAALGVVDAACSDGADFTELYAYGGPLPGLLLRDVDRYLEELDSLAVTESFDSPSDRFQLTAEVVHALAHSGQIDGALRLIDGEPLPTRRAVFLAVLANQMHRLGHSGLAVTSVFQRSMDAISGPSAPSYLIAALTDVAFELAPFDLAWSQQLARQALTHVDTIHSKVDRVRARTLLYRILSGSQSDAGMEKTIDGDEITDLIVERNSNRPQREKWTHEAAFDHMATALLAAILGDRNDVPWDELRRLRYLRVGGGVAYWEACAQWLSDDPDYPDQLATLIGDDPDFPNLWSLATGAVGWYASWLIRSGDVASLPRFPYRFADPDFRDAAITEVRCWLRASGRDFPTHLLPMYNPAVSAARQRAANALAAIGRLRSGDVDGALAHVAELYRGSGEPVVVRAWARRLGAYRYLRVPTALRALLSQHLLLDQVNPAALLSLSEAGRMAMSADLLSIAGSECAADVVEFVGGLQLSDTDRVEHTAEALYSCVEAEPLEVWAWVCHNRAQLRPDSIAPLAAALLRARGLPATTTQAISSLAKEVFLKRLSSDEYVLTGIADTSQLRLLHALAGFVPGEELVALAENVPDPVDSGPALCFAAAGMIVNGSPDGNDLFIEGIRRCQRAAGDSIEAVSAAAGEALGLCGPHLFPDFAARGVFEHWPGGIVGLYFGVAAIASELVRTFGPRPMVDFVARFHALRP